MKRFLVLLFIILFLPLSSFAKQHVDVAFTIDNNYPIFTLITIDSILKHNTSDLDYTFWIIEDNLTEENKAKMENYVKEKNQEIKFININMSKIDNGVNFYSADHPITRIAFARILLPDLLPQDIHKVLYLDSDILVKTDLKPLVDTDLGNYNVAMGINLEQFSKSARQYNFTKFYYNSGVILMNLDKCRKDNSPQQMLNYLQKNEKYFRKSNNPNQIWYKYPDQDLINIVWKGKIKKLDQKWNNQCDSCRFYHNNACVYHYIADLKPWEFKWPNVYCVRQYYVYWLKTPFWKYFYYYLYQRIIKQIKSIKAEL